MDLVVNHTSDEVRFLIEHEKPKGSSTDTAIIEARMVQTISFKQVEPETGLVHLAPAEI